MSAKSINPRGKAGRQPMLWAALDYAAGLWVGSYAWRPPIWWLVAVGVFAISAIHLRGARSRAASILGLAVLFFIAALAIQAKQSTSAAADTLSSTDGDGAQITAHIIREGDLQVDGFGGNSQRVDMVSEQITEGISSRAAQIGMRLRVYGKGETAQLFHYGDRMRFRAKLSAPRNYRNPGAFDYAGYLAENGINALGSVKQNDIHLLDGFAGNRFELWRTRMHHSVVEKVRQLWPESQSGLMEAVVIGEEEFISRPTRVDFQRSGTYHVLVVSGMNVTILALSGFWLLRKLRAGEVAASLLTAGLTISYAALTGLGSPVWRAALMLVVYFAARFMYRQKSMTNAIGAAALVLMIVTPQILFGASFQLTFLCVWLVAAIGVPLLERTTQPYVRGLRDLASQGYDVHLPPRVTQLRLDIRMIAGRKIPLIGLRILIGFAIGACELIMVSAVMQAGLALPMAYYFHRVTTVGLPANLLTIPLLEILMPSALAALIVGYVWLAPAKMLAFVAGLALNGVAGTVQHLGGLRIADTRVPTPQLTVMITSAVAIALAMILIRRRWLLAWVGLAAMFATAVWVCLIPSSPRIRKNALEITAIDVGQGDSILAVLPDGKTILIDAGGLPGWVHSELDMGEDVVSPYLWWRGFSHLDVVALTHAHADHMGGIPAILDNFHPKELWFGGDVAQSPELRGIVDAAQKMNVAVVQHAEGDNVQIGGARIRVLAPPFEMHNDPLGKRPGRNDQSLVMKISYGKTSALLEGDAERATEEKLTHEHPEADLLKVAHHGSATSTLPELLHAVRPQFAVISVGARNVYGHPRYEVLERLQSAKVSTYRTDLDGATSFYLDGSTVSATAPTLR
jgi:competence protein ComEC